MSTSQDAESVLDGAQLRESADLTIQCLEYAVQYILCKRSVYPRDKFQDVHKFGMSLVILRDAELQRYISVIFKTAHAYILKGMLHRLVLCIIRISTREVMERWQFRILPTEGVSIWQTASVGHDEAPPTADWTAVALEVNSEFAQLIKQLGVSFLPPHDHALSFKLLLYTKKSAELAENFVLTHPHSVNEGGEDFLQLREVATPTFKILSEVVYVDSN